jgi:hypothetical protein
MRINSLTVWITPFPHKKKGCSKMSRINQTEIIEKACRSLLRMFESGEMPEAVTCTFIEVGKYENIYSIT